MSHLELPKGYELVGKLGEGESGMVYCVQHQQSQEQFALKVLRNYRMNQFKATCREIEILDYFHRQTVANGNNTGNTLSPEVQAANHMLASTGADHTNILKPEIQTAIVKHLSQLPDGNEKQAMEAAVQVLAQYASSHISNMFVTPGFNFYRSTNKKDLYYMMPNVGGSLRSFLDAHRAPLEESAICWITAQLLLGTRFLHRRSLLHRDLAAKNVLMSESKGMAGKDGKCHPLIRLCDMGRSRTVSLVEATTDDDTVMTPYQTTPWNSSPEMLICGRKYNEKTDVWSVGCILGEMLKHKRCANSCPDFWQKSKKDQRPHLCKNISECIGSPTEEEYEVLLQNLEVLVHDGECKFPMTGKVCSCKAKTIPSIFQKLVKMKSPYPRLPAREWWPLEGASPAISEDCAKVLERIFCWNFNQRASSEELLGMPWFQQDPVLAAFIHQHLSEEQGEDLTTSTTTADESSCSLLSSSPEDCANEATSSTTLMTTQSPKKKQQSSSSTVRFHSKTDQILEKYSAKLNRTMTCLCHDCGPFMEFQHVYHHYIQRIFEEATDQLEGVVKALCDTPPTLVTIPLQPLPQHEEKNMEQQLRDG